MGHEVDPFNQYTVDYYDKAGAARLVMMGSKALAGFKPGEGPDDGPFAELDLGGGTLGPSGGAEPLSRDDYRQLVGSGQG